MAGLNLKVQLKQNQSYIGESTQQKIALAKRVIELYKTGELIPQEEKVGKVFLCFALNESDTKELTEISDKHKISMAELLRQGLIHLKLIVQK